MLLFHKRNDEIVERNGEFIVIYTYSCALYQERSLELGQRSKIFGAFIP